ncbi:hypothetical protein SV7mr_25390 [Stieleria bergensis]|uniref:Uncharacterized protein n=1 Tax=Stieleria bergensis TaxID=2528025 RepID=A0A517SVA1_9BACT|nr:hypothetical protein SV7mr_25390 [Planctomycetes bacterium SV_7m_r]
MMKPASRARKIRNSGGIVNETGPGLSGGCMWLIRAIVGQIAELLSAVDFNLPSRTALASVTETPRCRVTARADDKI